MKALTKSLIAAALAVAALSTGAQSNLRQTERPKNFIFIPGKAVAHPDEGLVRLSGVLRGEPNTSGRIDSVAVIIDEKRYLASDIDGIDFGRYFQWEDDGAIDLEIDFPGSPLPNFDRPKYFIFY